MTAVITVVSAFAAGRGSDAAALVFEYMAATQAETGQAVPAGIGELPAVLQREFRNLQASAPPAAADLPRAGGISHALCPGPWVGLFPCQS
jgi:hypothetical protein